jgi:hypothetical protein
VKDARVLPAHEDSHIATFEAAITPAPSQPQAPAEEDPEVRASAPEYETSTTIIERSGVEADYKAEPATIADQVEEAVSTAEAKVVGVSTSDPYHGSEEAKIPVQLAAAVTEPVTQIEYTETLPTTVVERPLLPIEPLVAVDGTALAVALLHDDERPVEVAPPVEVTPETAPSVTEPEGALVNSEVAYHEVDSAVVAPGPNTSPAHIEREASPTDSLSAMKGEELERPRSPWTPSYSVTTQGPGRSDIVESIVETKEQEDAPPPIKESTPEIVVDTAESVEKHIIQQQEDVPQLTEESTPGIVFDHIDAAEPVQKLDNQPDAEVTQEVDVLSPQGETGEEERGASKVRQSLLHADKLLMLPTF